MTNSGQCTILGYPRVGGQRELKRALEAYWKGQSDLAALRQTAKELRAKHWQKQVDAGLTQIPSNDFSYYDQVLDASTTFGVIPERYAPLWDGNKSNHETYFAIARGAQTNGIDVPASEMTKWFDTNYHYIVPEFAANQAFKLTDDKPIREYKEAKELGIETRPVLIGPISYLLLGKSQGEFSQLSLLDNFLPAYTQLIQQLIEAGAQSIQIDEPFLALDLDAEAKAAYPKAFEQIRQAAGETEIFLTTYFDDTTQNHDVLANLPVDVIHLDIVRGGVAQAEALATSIADNVKLSLGLVEGRNIWRNNLRASLEIAENIAEKIGKERVVISSSSSLLHSPYDLAYETKLDDEFKSWLAFANQKLVEVSTIAKGLNEGTDAIAEALAASDAVVENRKTSTRIHNEAVKARLAAVTAQDSQRQNEFAKRRAVQHEKLGLPLYPTTTIGSFPQTTDVREHRAQFKEGKISQAEYDNFLKQKTQEAVEVQKEIGLDVYVHGEFERNDMVEYFGEQMDGFAFTENGWVQSYGSRCVKPPVIFGDVSRPTPMTIEWTSYAQSLTENYMKGMLTGPVTILQWSFVRDDQPRRDTCFQIGLALRDEVVDLEKAGIAIIQIDEPAFREGLPLHQAEQQTYLDWAVEAFRISASGVEDATQIHTHMCYSEFNDIIDSIGAMDADVISIETSRSQMELLDAFVDYKYPNEIGPGVYDIHSPRVPNKDEIKHLINKAAGRIDADQLWVNPDCGLKTRAWPETKAALEVMVEATKELRQEANAEAAA